MTVMNIEHAIQHAEEKAAGLGGSCGEQHAQLARWLRELLSLREAISNPVAEVIEWEHPAHTPKCDIRWLRFDVKPGFLFSIGG